MANPIDPSISSKKNKYVNISGLQAFYDELPAKLTVDSAKSAGSAVVANNAQNLGGTAANNIINSAKSGAAASAWVTANQTDITNLKGIKAFKTIAGINATTSADSLSIVNGGNISVTTDNKTITLSAKDTTYTSLNEINTNEYKALTGVSGVTGYFNNGSAKSAVNATSATSAYILTNTAIKVSSSTSADYATNAGTANYATSAGSAPFINHDHNYELSGNGTGIKISGGVNIKPATNGNVTVSVDGKNILLSAKDTTYTTLNSINSNEYKALTSVSGVTGYFTNGSAKSADKATSASSASILTNKNIKVSSADYAVSAGAAPLVPHDHEYQVKVNGTDGTALSIKNDIGLKVSGSNIKYYVSGQDIYISAKDTTYGANDFITASSATNISNAYTWANDWNSTKTNLVNSAKCGAAASSWIDVHKDDYLAKSYSSNSTATFAGTANSANYATKAGSATSAAVLTNTGIKVASAISADYATNAGSASKAATLTNTAIKVNSSISADYATNAGSASSAATLTNTAIKVSSATSADYATLAGSATNAANLTNTAITVKYSQTANYANSAGSASKLTAARNIAASGDVTWSVSFNGAAGVTGNATVNNVPWKAISAHTGTVNSSTTNKFTTPKAVYDFVTASIVTKAAFIGPETSLDNFTTPYDKTAIYLVGPVGTGTDKYNEYVVTGTAGTTADFLLIGDTSTDLSDYHKTADFNTWTAARFDGNSAKWAKSATSATNAANLTNKNIKVSSATSADYATNAGSASYATSAGAAPFISHDHNYKISAGTTAFNVSSNIQLSAGTNIGLVSAGTNVIGITAKDTTPNNKTITITSGASPATGSFTLNQNSDKTITLGTMAFKASGDFSTTSHNHNYKLSGAGTALDVSAGINLKPNGNIAISTAANTINISAKDTTYTSLNGVNSTEYNALTGVSGVKSIKNYAAISAASGSTSKGSFAPANSADTFTLIAGNNIDFISGANSLTISSKTYTLPTVNNKTITITTGASPATSQTFTLNQSSDKTISLGTMAFKASGDFALADHNHNMTALNGTANFFSGTTAAPSALSALTAKYAVSAGAAPVASHQFSSHTNFNTYFNGTSANSALTSKSALSAGSATKAASATSALTAGLAQTVTMSEWTANSARPITFSHPSAKADSLGYDSVFTFNPSSHILTVPYVYATTISGNLSGNATSAKNAGTATYATSAGAAPFIAHDHGYTLSGNGTAVNVSAGVNFKPSGSNIQFFVSGNDIYISGKNTTGTDTNVTQSLTGANSAFRILLKKTANNTDETSNVVYDGDFTYNPSSNLLSVVSASATNLRGVTVSASTGNLLTAYGSSAKFDNISGTNLNGTSISNIIGSAQSGNKALTALSALSGIKSFNVINASSGTGTVTAITADSSGASWNLKVAGVMSITADTATNTITLSSRDNNSTAYIPSGQKISGIYGSTTGQYFLSALKLNAGDNITFTSASNSQITINATQPTVGNGTITINTGSTTATGTFTTNQNTNTTITLGSMALTQTGTYFSGTSALSALTAKSAQSAGKATKTQITDHTANDDDYAPIWTNPTNSSLYTTSSKYKFNPAAGRLYVSNIVKVGGCSMTWNSSTSALDFNF